MFPSHVIKPPESPESSREPQRAPESSESPSEPQRPPNKGATSNALHKTRACIVIEICCNRTGYESVTKIFIANIHWQYVQSGAQPCLAKCLCPCLFFLKRPRDHDEVGTSTQKAGQVPVQLHHTFIYCSMWFALAVWWFGLAVWQLGFRDWCCSAIWLRQCTQPFF